MSALGSQLLRVNGEPRTLFSVTAPDAEQVWLCIFPEQGEEHRHEMLHEEDGVWRFEIGDCPAGTRYGYRAEGTFRPRQGLWFNPSKLLMDPYTRQLTGTPLFRQALFEPGFEHADSRRNDEDSAPFMPRSVVVDNHFDWHGDVAPAVPWSETVLYELHVKGVTKLHPEISESARGRYLGLAEEPLIEHLRKLGVTTVQLMPCSAFTSEPHLIDRGLSNYWGYNPLALFAPHAAYANRDPVGEFKTMVRILHKEGIEVIMDIVLNHTAEGNEFGPTLAFRGLDNLAWYRLVPESPMHYQNYSGCGNSLNTAHPRTLAFTLDCLRYWVQEMHVDGFRFDLAASLGRDETGAFNPESGFFKQIAQDPVLSRIKLIAEPWDVGPHGYQLGRFPKPWRECNGDYRDIVRGFWNQHSVTVGAFAERIAGSSDIYRANERTPTASVNFVTCHDGFTLHDLVSYDGKHNLANGEDNRDGGDFNLSANHGAEGDSDDPAIQRLRQKQMRNLLTTLILSQGVPHILAGDELAHSQRGNNNAYCQDNALSWLNWEIDEQRQEHLAFLRNVLSLRRDCAGFRREDFLNGQPLHGQEHISAIKDVSWLHPSGREMRHNDWHDPHLHALGMLLVSHPLPSDPVFAHLVLYNASREPVEFTLPECPGQSAWSRLFDTSTTRPELPFSSQTYRLDERACAAFLERVV